jgi:hypothetical protein
MKLMRTVGTHEKRTIKIGVFTTTLGAFWNVIHIRSF